MMFTHSAWLLRCSTFRNLLTVMSAEFCHIEQNPEAQFWIFFFLWANRLQKFQPADNATFRRNKNRNCKLHAHLETTFPIKLERLAKEYGILRRCATMLRDAWRSVSSCHHASWNFRSTLCVPHPIPIEKPIPHHICRKETLHWGNAVGIFLKHFEIHPEFSFESFLNSSVEVS